MNKCKYKLTMTSKYDIISIIKDNQLIDYSFDKLVFIENSDETEIKKSLTKSGYVIYKNKDKVNISIIIDDTNILTYEVSMIINIKYNSLVLTPTKMTFYDEFISNFDEIYNQYSTKSKEIIIINNVENNEIIVGNNKVCYLLCSEFKKALNSKNIYNLYGLIFKKMHESPRVNSPLIEEEIIDDI